MTEADRAALLAWYLRERRDLPWRRTRDPYRILVSEVMLQQTQVARVVPRYERFLDRFPDVAALAASEPRAVIAEWSGLGYNRRALALRGAAIAVDRDGWPRTAMALRALPGVGPYTAAAVATFAFGERVAAVDTNIRRVIERVDGRRRPEPALARRAGRLVPADDPASWNQAVMELGATVCTARRPDCGRCPVARCRSRGRAATGARRRPDGAATVRFEDTDRFVRGRVVAALVAHEPLPSGLAPGRVERAVDGLVADGLVERDACGGVRLPAG